MTKLTLQLALALFGLLFFFSCERESVTDKPDPAFAAITDKTVLAAKKWHDARQTGTTARLGGTDDTEKTPNWLKAISYTVGTETIVELPIAYKKPQGMTIARGGGDKKPGEAYQRLVKEDISVVSKYVVVKDADGHYKALVMKVVGSMLFYASHKQDELKTSSYKSVPTDFSGYVLFYDWNETMLYGYRYQVGQLIGTCSPGTKPNGRLVTCNTTPVDHYSQACTEGYGCGPLIYTYTDYVTTCYDSGNGGGAGPGGTTGGGGGGSTGGGQAVTDANGNYYIPNYYNPPVVDVKKLMDCFGENITTATNYNYTITVYVQEPLSGGGGSSYGFNHGPGHVFIGLTRVSNTNPSDRINQVFGFYPNTPTLSPAIWVVGQYKDNGIDTPYTVKKLFR
ncbi:hypothetical protein [Fibrella arboris]|uniref:hypothetical protein n=1 Tax=Fibrella arboris TaxID=3242486 RepID=UPI00351FF46C